MKKISFIHTADWHIGLTSWTKIDRTKEICNLLDELLEYIKYEDIDFIIIAGDLFDKITPSYEDINTIYKYINKFAKLIPVYIILGNHDWKGLGFLNYFSNSTNIFITETFKNYTYKDIADIYTISYFQIRKLLFKFNQENIHKEGSNLLKNYIENNINNQLDTQRFNIFVYHGSIDGALYTDEISKFSEFFLSKDILPDVDYVALGHIHNQQQINTHVKTFYSGSLIKTNFAMKNAKTGALHITIDEYKNFDIKRINLKPKELSEITIDAQQNLENLQNKLKEDNADYIKILIKQLPENITFPILRNNIFSLDNRIVKVQLSPYANKLDNYYTSLEEYKTLKNKDINSLFKQYLKETNNYNKEIIDLFEKYYKEAKYEVNSNIEEI